MKNPPKSFGIYPLTKIVAMSVGLTVVGLQAASAQTNGNDISTFTGGTFNWNTPANWESGNIADGIGAIATFDNNYTTSNVSTTFNNGSNFTLGRLNFTPVTTNREFTLAAGTGNTATLKFDDTDNVSNIAFTMVNTSGTNPQIGGAGTLNITGDANENLVIDINGTNAVRFAAGANWSGFAGRVTLNSGRFQTEPGTNVLPTHSEIVIGNGVQVRALFNNDRNQSIRGLSGGNSTSFVGTNDNASVTGTLTVGNNSIVSDAYNFTGVLGGDGFTTSQPNSNFNVTKTGAGTQRLSGDNIYTGSTNVNNGTLLVNGSHTTTTGTGQYIVASGGTLGGTGTIGTAASVGGGVQISVVGTLNPGDGGTDIDTLNLNASNTVKSMIAIENAGTLRLDINTGSSDNLNLIGASANDIRFISGTSTIAFNDLSSGALFGSFEIISTDSANNNVFGFGSTTFSGAGPETVWAGDGSVTGFITVTGLDAYGASASIYLQGGDMFLHVVPEPSTWAMTIGACILLIIFGRRRRRAC